MQDFSPSPNLDEDEHEHPRPLSPWQQSALWYAGIAVVCVVLYRLSIGFGFVYDDHQLIVSNPAVRSLSHVWEAWTHQLWSQSIAKGNYYRPILATLNCINYALFKMRPAGWHAVGILLHVVACWGVFALARRLGFERNAAGAAALIFAVHPVHVECVSWVSAQSDTLAAAFYIFAFSAFLASREGTRRGRKLAMALVLAAGAMFTKEVGVTFPAMVLLYEWCYSRGEALATRARRSVVAMVPFAVVALVYLGARAYVMRGLHPNHMAVSTGSVLLTLPSVVARYVEILLFPVGLNTLYYTPYVHSFSMLDVGIPLLTAIAVVVLLWYVRRRTGDPLIAFASWWMLIPLLPTLYLPIFPMGNFVRDRYVYLSSVGLVLIVVALVRRIPERSAEQPYLVRGVVCAVLVAGLGLGAAFQQVYWANDMAVAYRGFQTNPRNVAAELYYAEQLAQQDQYERARGILEHVMKQTPEDRMGHYDQMFQQLAFVDYKLGKMDEGKAAFAEAERHSENAGTSLGKATRAQLYAMYGDTGKALELFSEVVRDTPDSAQDVYNYAYTLYLARRYEDAEWAFRHFLTLKDDAKGHLYLGETLMHEQKLADAESELKRAIAIDPAQEGAHAALGLIYELQGHKTDAAREYQTELAQHPQNKAAAERLAALTHQ